MWSAVPNRRRFLGILAATGAALLTRAAKGAPSAKTAAWEGTALGADARIVLAGLSPAEAEAAFAAALAEIRRLEALFSLYDPASALSRLNASGRLAGPALEFLELLDHARAVHAASSGVFDPTIQPLWRLHARAARNARAPSKAALESAQSLVGLNRVEWSSEAVMFLRPGMALTLNGIAQGYITDRVAEVLRTRGLTSALINLGEYRAIGEHPDSRPWRIGIQDPFQAHGLADTVALSGQALATSGAYGGRFGPDGDRNHLIDPRTGRSAERYASVSVVHASACIADGLSTAFSFLEESAIAAAARRFGASRVVIIGKDGTRTRL